MNKTVAIVDFLQNWQNVSYEEVESAEDIKVYNIVGTIVQLIRNGYMNIGSIFDFIEDNLSLDSKIKQRIAQVISNAYDSANQIH